MSEDEVYEMQRKIDEGIYLAQKRLVERAKHNHTTLIIAREGQVVEVKAEELYPIRKKYRPQIRLQHPFIRKTVCRTTGK